MSPLCDPEWVSQVSAEPSILSGSESMTFTWQPPKTHHFMAHGESLLCTIKIPYQPLQIFENHLTSTLFSLHCPHFK
jgi:hypothetical protein